MLWLVSLASVVSLMSAAMAESGGAQTDADFTSLEKEIAREVNLARTKPSQYAGFIEQWKAFYRDRRIERPGEVTILTEEGVPAVQEAIGFLRAIGPRPSAWLRPMVWMFDNTA